MGVLLHAHYRLMGPDGQKIVMPAPIDAHTPHALKSAARLRASADESGWLALHVAGRGLAAAGAAYELKVTYTGTQEPAS